MPKAQSNVEVSTVVIELENCLKPQPNLSQNRKVIEHRHNAQKNVASIAIKYDPFKRDYIIVNKPMLHF